jgi:hypothetical protein
MTNDNEEHLDPEGRSPTTHQNPLILLPKRKKRLLEEPVNKGPQLICTGYARISKKSYFKQMIGCGPDSLRANVLLSVLGHEMIIRKSLIP